MDFELVSVLLQTRPGHPFDSEVRQRLGSLRGPHRSLRKRARHRQAEGKSWITQIAQALPHLEEQAIRFEDQQYWPLQDQNLHPKRNFRHYRGIGYNEAIMRCRQRTL